MRYHSNSDLGKAYEAGYVDGRAAAQAAMPPRELTQAMLDAGSLVFVRKRQDYIPKWEPSIAGDFWRAMYDAWAQEQTSGAASAVTDGPAADPLPVAWATPSLLVTLSAVEKNHLTNPDRRTRGGEFESAAADAERYSVPLYAAPPAQAEPQEGDLLHTMMEWARTEEGRKQLADSYRPHLWACAKRVADPQNEAATCRHWCGDIEHCQPIASAPAQAEPQPEHAGPIAWLRTLNGDPDWQEDCVHAYEDDARRNLNAYIEGAGEGEVYSIIPLYAASPAQAEPQPDPTPNLGPFSSSLGVAAPDVAALVEPQAEAIPIAPVEVVRQALKELLESISECRMDQVTARFAKASVMARAVVDRYKDAT